MPKKQKLEKPKSVTIFGKKVKIVYKDTDSDSDLHGEFNLDKMEISIHSASCKRQEDLDNTLLHEYIHACLGITGLTEILSSEQEEALARCLENGLKDNYARIY